MKTTSKQSTASMTDTEILQVNGGNSLSLVEVQAERGSLPVKPIRYYTQALGEDGGDLPDLLTM
ncbi:hypothetical protein [Salinimonas chungwhensis]|uniref:hypothetical protein n=1 Tax=Salinimonas chungwhensis TaxID=265425 RepID=UPI00035EEFBC|nr:hypothetical protein [Salinimonas chungwhensis]